MSEESQQLKVIKFSTECTMASVPEHYQQIMDAMHQTKSVKLDLTDVKRVDASFVQLLIASQLEAKRFGFDFEVSGNSAVVDELSTHIFCHISFAKTGNQIVKGV